MKKKVAGKEKPERNKVKVAGEKGVSKSKPGLRGKPKRAAVKEDRRRDIEAILRRKDLQLRALNSIGARLSEASSLDDTLKMIMCVVTGIMEAERSTLYLVDEKRVEVVSRIAQESGVQEIRVPLGTGIAGWVAASGRPVRLKDAYRDSRFYPQYDELTGFRTKSILAVPMVFTSGGVLGVVQVLNKKSGDGFTKDDQEILNSIASQAAILIENVQLLRSAVEKRVQLEKAKADLEMRMAELDVLYEVEKGMSLTGDTDSLLEEALSKVTAVLGAGAASLLLKEEDGQRLFFRSAVGGMADEVKKHRLHLGQGIVGWVAANGIPVISNEAGKDDRHDRDLAGLLGFSVRSVLCVPLMSDGEVAGAFEVLNKKAGPFTESDLKVLTLLGAQVLRRLRAGREREERERRERLASIGEMLSGILHDFRTPMAIIQGYAQMMASSSDVEKKAVYSATIARQCRLINAMAREVVDFARGSTNVLLRSVPVPPFIEEMKEVIQKEFEGKEITLSVLTAYEGAALMDEDKMKRVFFNLACNAASSMRDGGRFTITIEKVEDRIIFSFEDTGGGIPDELRDKLFKPFEAAGPGTWSHGLGLAIVKSIVDQHGGTISLKSMPGTGTTFTIGIPFSRQEQAQG